jgi:hypothetical protein
MSTHHTGRARRVRAAAVAALASLALVAAACGVSLGSVHITGSGNLETRTYDLSGFTSISASHTFDVTVTRGDAFAVSVTADDNLYDDILVEVRGTTLSIGLRSRVSLIGPSTLKAAVTMPSLSGVDLSGASKADISGFTTPGSLRLSASGAGVLTGEVAATALTVELSGASRATLTGTAESASLSASGASRLSLADLRAGVATVDLSGASSGDVTATGSLDRVTISGASRLTYGGGGTLGTVSTSGASSLSAR